jgi:hypothetical protein
MEFLEIHPVHDPPKLEGGKFDFLVKYRTVLENKSVTKLTRELRPRSFVPVACEDIIRTTILQKMKSPNTRLSFRLTTPPDAMEITADLTVQSAEVEKKIKSEAKIVDFGFRKHTFAPVPDLQEPIPETQAKKSLWNLGKAARKSIPTFQ